MPCRAIPASIGLISSLSMLTASCDWILGPCPEKMRCQDSSPNAHQPNRHWPLSADRRDEMRQRVLSVGMSERAPLEIGEERDRKQRPDNPWRIHFRTLIAW